MHWLLSVAFECWSWLRLGPVPGPFVLPSCLKYHQKTCALRRQLSPDNVCFCLTHMYFKHPSKPVHVQKLPSTLSRKLQDLSLSHLTDQILPIPITESLLSNAITLIEAISISYGEGNGTPLHYSYLEHPMDGGAWWAAVYGFAKSQDRTEQLHFHFSLSCTREGNGNPLQCSCLENPRDGGAWSMGLHRVGHD